MAVPSLTPNKWLELTKVVRDARKRQGNALFAAHLQAKYGRAPSVSFIDLSDEEASTALDKKYLEGGDGDDKRVLVQIMTWHDYREPTFYDDHARIMVDPTLFEVLAELDRVYVEDCADTTPSTPSSSLPQAILVNNYDKDGNDELYAWRICFMF